MDLLYKFLHWFLNTRIGEYFFNKFQNMINKMNYNKKLEDEEWERQWVIDYRDKKLTEILK